MTESMNVVSLFAGIGGLELGLERAGMRVVGQVEIDPFRQQVLATHWPEVPRHDDVRTATQWWRSQQRPHVDLACGGFPCQPVSLIGKGRGAADPRWLWPPFAEFIGSIRPEWVLFENVPGLRTRGLRTVLADLDRLGYRVRVGTLSACAVGAPHTRERLFGLAHAPRYRRRAGGAGRPAGEVAQWRDQSQEGMDNRAANAGRGAGHWASEPDVARLVDGLPRDLVERTGQAYGNAVVPQVTEQIGHMIMTATIAHNT